MPARITLPCIVERQGGRSITFQTTMAQTPLIVKLTTERNSYPIEAWVYRALGQAGLPVPRVAYYNAKLPRLALPCLVMSKLAGQPIFLCDREPLASQLYEDVGAMLGRIHAVALPRRRFGLGAFMPNRVNAKATWTGFIETHHTHPAAGRYLRAHDLLPPVAVAVFEGLSERVAAHAFGAVLNHGDFGPDHILVHEGRISGIIDAGEAFVGPAEYDLAYLACYITDQQFEAVLHAYPKAPDVPMIYVYMFLIALHKAARAHRIKQLVRARHFVDLACHAAQRMMFRAGEQRSTRSTSDVSVCVA